MKPNPLASLNHLTVPFGMLMRDLCNEWVVYAEPAYRLSMQSLPEDDNHPRANSPTSSGSPLLAACTLASTSAMVISSPSPQPAAQFATIARQA